ncbi:MAG: transglycosylase SLT domain-containing protein [Rubrivivax sp.]
MQTLRAWTRAARTLLQWSHHGLAVLGLLLLGAGALFATHASVREQAAAQVLGWLQQRHDLRPAEPAEAPSGTAVAGIDPATLTPQQGAVAQWLTRQYKVAPQPLALLVQEAWTLGQRFGLDPTLILAVVAVQSSFNPLAQGTVGAQGLMHVVTADHDAKFEAFGGALAAFDPLANLRVGVIVLQDSVRRAGGSLPEGLRLYLGAGDPQREADTADRVLAEQTRLRNVANAAPGQDRLAAARP